MSAGVLSLSLIVDRLKATCPDFRLIDGAAGYVRAQSQPFVFPSAFVLPLADRAGRNRYAGECAVGQEITASFAVMYLARDIRQDRGNDALSELETARIAVRSALVGWSPTDTTESCRMAQGRLVSGIAQDGSMVWQDDFTTKLDLRSIQ